MEEMFKFVERFGVLEKDEKAIILETNKVKEFPKNEIIKNFNEPTNSSFFVLSGIVYSSVENEHNEVVSDFFFAGDPVILAQDPSLYRITTLTDSKLAVANPQQVETLVRKIPKFESVCRLFAEERLAEKISFSDSLKSLSAIEKYKLLFNKNKKNLERVPLRLVASYLGVTPETLSRVRKQVAKNSMDLGN